MDLDIKYRPTSLPEVVGQDAAVKVIRSWKGDVPRAVLLTGGTGSGKTTLARIIVREAGVDTELDLTEHNCGMAESAKDMVRGISDGVPLSPMGTGSRRAWILDELQNLSGAAKVAQGTLLKVLEEFPRSKPLFVLCTTDPEKILPAIRGRCVTLALKTPKPADIAALVTRVAQAEGIPCGEELTERIAANAGGAFRNALKLLELVRNIPDHDERLTLVSSGSDSRTVLDLIKAVLPYTGKPNWAAASAALNDLNDEEPEGTRQALLNTARGVLLRSKSATPQAVGALKLIRMLAVPLYDRNTANADLAAACFEMCHGGK